MTAYEGDEAYVFVSYSHDDDDLVHREIDWLQSQGFNVWYDEGITGASRWRDELAERIQKCHLFLFYASPQSVASQVCREELEYALEKERPILSVHLAPTSFPEGLKLAIANRQALIRHELDDGDYTRKLASVVASRLEQPLPASTEVISTSRKTATVAKFLWGTSIVVIATLLVMSGAWISSLNNTTLPMDQPGVKAFSIDLGPSASILNQNDVPKEIRSELAMSPDGNLFAYSKATRILDTSGVGTGIFIRSLDNLEPAQLTDLVLLSPFFSPDGQWLAGVTAAWPLIKIPLKGGSPQVITQGGWPPTGGTWLEDDTIIFTRQNDEDAHSQFDRSLGFQLYRISADGGEVTRLTTPDKDADEYGHRRPEALPGGEAVLFDIVRIDPDIVVTDEDPEANTAIDIALLDLESGDYRTLINNAHGPRYAASGHIVFTRGSDIWAVPFSLAALAINGDEALVRSGVQVTSLAYGNVPYAFSAEGSLVMLPEMAPYLPLLQFVWVSRNGAEETIGIPQGMYSWPRVSPDGSKLIVEKREELLGTRDLWVHEFNRPTSMTRITSDEGRDANPVWLPDGEHVVFGSPREGQFNIYRIRADGAGSAVRLLESSSLQAPSDITPDGSTVVFTEFNDATGWDIGAADIDPSGDPTILLQTTFHEGTVSVSPDGNWIVYGSSDNGQIYLRPFPNMSDGKWQVSTEGGTEPLWSLQGTEIFYRAGTAMIAVPVETSPRVELGVPRTLFEGAYYSVPIGSRQYDLEYPAGNRFLMLKAVPRSDSTQLVYIHNWFEELKRLAPTD